jgi:hypothetical protein
MDSIFFASMVMVMGVDVGRPALYCPGTARVGWRNVKRRNDLAGKPQALAKKTVINAMGAVVGREKVRNAKVSEVVFQERCAAVRRW